MGRSIPGVLRRVPGMSGPGAETGGSRGKPCTAVSGQEADSLEPRVAVAFAVAVVGNSLVELAVLAAVLPGAALEHSSPAAVAAAAGPVTDSTDIDSFPQFFLAQQLLLFNLNLYLEFKGTNYASAFK